MTSFHPIPFDSLHSLDSPAPRSIPARTTGTSSRSDQLPPTSRLPAPPWRLFPALFTVAATPGGVWGYRSSPIAHASAWPRPVRRIFDRYGHRIMKDLILLFADGHMIRWTVPSPDVRRSDGIGGRRPAQAQGPAAWSSVGSAPSRLWCTRTWRPSCCTRWPSCCGPFGRCLRDGSTRPSRRPAVCTICCAGPSGESPAPARMGRNGGNGNDVPGNHGGRPRLGALPGLARRRIRRQAVAEAAAFSIVEERRRQLLLRRRCVLRWGLLLRWWRRLTPRLHRGRAFAELLRTGAASC